MSDPRIIEWTWPDILEQLEKTDAQVDQDLVHQAYQNMVNEGHQAYRQKMDVMAEDAEYWTLPDSGQLATPVDFSQQEDTNYSRAEEGLEKKRQFYGAINSETREPILVMDDTFYAETEANED